MFDNKCVSKLSKIFIALIKSLMLCSSVFTYFYVSNSSDFIEVKFIFLFLFQSLIHVLLLFQSLINVLLMFQSLINVLLLFQSL